MTIQHILIVLLVVDQLAVGFLSIIENSPF